MANSANSLAGVVGIFEDADSLVEAARKTKEGKWKSFDAFTPFPVHGLDDAMGLKRSFLPYITFVAGLTGTCVAFLLQYWTSVVDWPINVGGKPLHSWPAFVPIYFELTVLFAGVTTVLSLILIMRLPNVTKKSFDPRITCDRFAILIEAQTGNNEEGFRKFSENDASQFLKQVGAKEVKSVHNEGWF